MKKVLYLSIAICAFAACAKQMPDQPGISDEITFNVSLSSASTKATANAFEADDAIGVYAVEYDGGEQMPLQIGGNFINNEMLTYNGVSWAGVRTLYWSDQPCDFYAIYPYQPNITSIGKYPFSVNTVQDAAGYEASDLMFAYVENVSRSGDGVELVFSHIMSKLKVNVVKGSNFEGEIPDDIVAHVYNTAVDCTVDWMAGSVEKDAFGAKRTITMKKLSNSSFEAILVPQNIEKHTPLIELTMGGIAYLLEYSLSFRPGFVHTVNLTLNTSPDQEQIEISIDPGIDDWD